MIMSTIWYEGPADGGIKERYGLDEHEWGGSLSDRVAAIIDKDDPWKETHVNALLRDGVDFYAQKTQDHPELGDDDQMRDAISYVAHSGVLIDDETLLALTEADDKYVIPAGGDSLMYEYNKMHQPDYGRLYQRQSDAAQLPYAEATDDEIKQHYGLDPHEWKGSLSDKVMAIVNKNTPDKETHVNALLRDGARLFAQNMEAQPVSGVSDDALRYAVESGGDELRAAISDASWAGVLINDEAMEAIKHVEKEYITEFGGDSLTRSYDQMRKLNDARAHYREAAKEMRTASPAAPVAQATQNFDRFAPPQGARVTTVPPPVRTIGSARSAQPFSPVPPIPQPPKTPGSQARTGGPVRVGNVAKDWLASMGRDEKGQPLTSTSAPSGQSPAPSVPKAPAQRSGSIQAALPGSGVTVGRSTPRVPPTAYRMGIPEPQVQTPSVDDGFEL
jgi:hypothetical protein